ncbi:Transposon Ty3-I Gag-Pol poly [Labeo rohita]|uniref:Gypsy retrotransposon integrase-like protein 1 n=1 Tax=Labeo rohita TaxID=84645 RepID=A0A498L5W3_LABRO|nr:Transposon Ty3-I Gag-Pol poly [Labeo rohita]
MVLIYRCCAVYLDDIVVASPTFKQHLEDLKEVLSRLKSAGLTIKLAKCQFCRSELTFLGYRVCPSGILPDQDKVKAVMDFKTPVNVKQVRQFLGLSGYYRRFIQDYARHAEPLFALTKNDTPFVWDSACQDAMDLMKQKLTSAPILSFPDFMLPFFIHADACDAGLGAALMQKDLHGREVAVAYASRALHKSEKPYSTPEKECLAVIWALEHFRPYIEGLHVTIFTDHSGLKWLMSRPNPTGRLARWSLRLQDFDFDVVHKPGSRNKVPDALSRNPVTDDVPPMDLLPDYAVIGGLDLRTLSSVTLTDRSHVRQLQLDDPITGDLLRKMEAALQRNSDEEDCSQYSIHDGLLYFNDPKPACGIHPLKCLKLYAPTSLRGTLLSYYHDHPTAGHLGITKTLARLKRRFFWPKMVSEVKKYVTSCTVCQLTKPSQRKPAGLMIPIRPQKPWEYVGVDFVGPLPRTPCGNVYILVFVDYFSKWVEIVAVREATAQVAASKLLSEVFSRHGAPTYLISDRGSPFVSDLFKRVLTLLGTEQRLTTAYHPQTNATERVNRTLKTAFRAYVDEKHTTWDRYIPQICFALRTAPHESTGQTPSMMLYGRELDTSLDLVTQPVWDGMEEPEIPYPESLRLSLQEAHDHAKAALETSHNRRKQHYDKRRRSVSYATGDLVRVKTHPKSDALANFTAKLAPLYSGPYRVTQVLSDVNYRLAKLDTGQDAGVYHVVNMQPFHTWNACSSNSASGLQDGSEAPDEGLEDSLLATQMRENQPQETCFFLPNDTVVDCDNFTDNAHDRTRHDMSSTHCADADVNTSTRHSQLPEFDVDLQDHGYNLRPRLAPRITSGWSDRKWTNEYHTDRLDLK